MSNLHLPQEIIDHIIDILHDEPETLNACCLVSKSWIPQTRKYLFADIRFNSARHLELWKGTFPDPSDSPACYTHTLTICSIPVDIRPAVHVRRKRDLMQTFLHIYGFESPDPAEPAISGCLRGFFAGFYGFSPTLRSLHVNSLILPCQEFFNLVLSCPLLEDLTMSGKNKPLGWRDGNPHWSQNSDPSTPPPLTGSLDLCMPGGIGYATRWLLDLPNGLHFRELKFPWFHEEDLQWMTELVAGCSDTLERIDIGKDCLRTSDSSLAPIDLSKATKLADAVFRPGSSLKVDWIVSALRTITKKNQDFRNISIRLPYHPAVDKHGVGIREIIGDRLSRHWSELDRVLIQLSEARSIRPKVVFTTLETEEEDSYMPTTMRECVESLLPEAMMVGVVDLVRLYETQ